MAVFKNTFTRAINVIASADCDVPNPALFIVSCQSTGTATNQLIDINADFIAAGVQVGDIVYNVTEQLAATVINVINSTTLELNGDAVQAGLSDCDIYAGTQNSASSAGCFLYNPSAVTRIAVSVKTIGGDAVAFDISQNFQFCPIQVRSVISSSGTPIIALW
jgi:hypothetical protein